MSSEASSKLSRKKAVDDYPQAYFQILEHFIESEEPIIIPNIMWEDAHSQRKALYRFFEALRDAEPNIYRKKLYNVSRDLVMSVSPARGKTGVPAKLVIRFPPAVLAFRDFNKKDNILPSNEKETPKVLQTPKDQVEFDINELERLAELRKGEH